MFNYTITTRARAFVTLAFGKFVMFDVGIFVSSGDLVRDKYVYVLHTRYRESMRGPINGVASTHVRSREIGRVLRSYIDEKNVEEARKIHTHACARARGRERMISE